MTVITEEIANDPENQNYIRLKKVLEKELSTFRERREHFVNSRKRNESQIRIIQNTNKDLEKEITVIRETITVKEEEIRILSDKLSTLWGQTPVRSRRLNYYNRLIDRLTLKLSKVDDTLDLIKVNDISFRFSGLTGPEQDIIETMIIEHGLLNKLISFDAFATYDCNETLSNATIAINISWSNDDVDELKPYLTKMCHNFDYRAKLRSIKIDGQCFHFTDSAK